MADLHIETGSEQYQQGINKSVSVYNKTQVPSAAKDRFADEEAHENVFANSVRQSERDITFEEEESSGSEQ